MNKRKAKKVFKKMASYFMKRKNEIEEIYRLIENYLNELKAIWDNDIEIKIKFKERASVFRHSLKELVAKFCEEMNSSKIRKYLKIIYPDLSKSDRRKYVDTFESAILNFIDDSTKLDMLPFFVNLLMIHYKKLTVCCEKIAQRISMNNY